jgi:hypothetical protein
VWGPVLAARAIMGRHQAARTMVPGRRLEFEAPSGSHTFPAEGRRSKPIADPSLMHPTWAPVVITASSGPFASLQRVPGSCPASPRCPCSRPEARESRPADTRAWRRDLRFVAVETHRRDAVVGKCPGGAVINRRFGEVTPFPSRSARARRSPNGTERTSQAGCRF